MPADILDLPRLTRSETVTEDGAWDENEDDVVVVEVVTRNKTGVKKGRGLLNGYY